MSNANQMLHETKSPCLRCLICFTGENVVMLQLDIIREKSAFEEVLPTQFVMILDEQVIFSREKGIRYCLHCRITSEPQVSSTRVTTSRSVSFECIHSTILLTVVAWKISVLSSSWHRTMWLVVSGESPQFGHTFMYLVESIFERCALISHVPVTCFVMKMWNILGNLFLVTPSIPFQ